MANEALRLLDMTVEDIKDGRLMVESVWGYVGIVERFEIQTWESLDDLVERGYREVAGELFMKHFRMAQERIVELVTGDEGNHGIFE